MKKPKKSEIASIFDSIKQTPTPIQDPLKTEKFYSVDGERMTRITHRLNPIPVEISADKMMKAASEIPWVLIQRDPWHSILPWLGNSEAKIKKILELLQMRGRRNGTKYRNQRIEVLQPAK